MIIRNPSDGSIKLHAANAPPSSDAEPVFMQVCLFNQGGSFNVGQSFKYKFIMFSEIMFKVVQDLELWERLPYETQTNFWVCVNNNNWLMNDGASILDRNEDFLQYRALTLSL